MENVLSLPVEYSKKFEYKGVTDIVVLFSSDVKITHLIEFICSELEELTIPYHNEKLEMMPVAFLEVPTRSKAEYVTIDYSFFVQCIARYIHKFELGDARQFLLDFLVESDFPETKRASIFLFHHLLEELLKITYINGRTAQQKVVFIRFSVPSIWQNARCVMELSGINLSITKLKEITADVPGLIDRLVNYSKLSKATQVAFGKEAADYWVKNKQKPLYFMSKQSVTHLKKRG